MRESAAALPGLEAFVATVFPGHLAVVDQLIPLPSGEKVGWVRFERVSDEPTAQRFYELLAAGDIHWIEGPLETSRFTVSTAPLVRAEAVAQRGAEIRDEYLQQLSSGQLRAVIKDLAVRAQSGEWVGQQNSNAFAGSALDPAEFAFLLAQDAELVESEIKTLIANNELAITSEGRLGSVKSKFSSGSAVGF